MGGVSEVPVRPERIVVLYTYAWGWPIAQLGVEPIGTDNVSEYVGEIERYDPRSADILAEAAAIGDETGPNFERIASLEPDLIVGGWWDDGIYDELSQIAPTVLLDYRDETDLIAWQRSLVELVGATELGWFEERVAEYERRIEALRESHPDLWPNLRWKSIGLFGSDVYAADPIPVFPSVKVFGDLGATMWSLGDPEKDPISMELLPSLDADVIFVTAREDTSPETGRALDLLGNTFAGRRGQVFVVPSQPWEFVNVQSLHLILDEVERHLTGRKIETRGDAR